MAKIWSIFQFVIGLLLVWVVLDIGVGALWVAGWLGTMASGWLSVEAVLAYLLFLYLIFELIKELTSE